MMKLPEYAKRIGISRAWALELFKRGELPHPAQRISERVVLVDVPEDFGKEKPEGKTVAYARVSTSNRKEALEEQKLRILEYCVENGIKVDEVVTEIGSGMNPKRPKLLKVLKNPFVETIVVEHRDRFTRMNFELIEAALQSKGGQIIVIDDEEIEDDLVRDVSEILTSLCARIYGKRSANLKAQKLAKEVSDELQ